MKKVWWITIIFVTLVVVSYLGYSFLKTENCQDLECFQKNLADCSKAKFTNQAEWVYEYKILGEKQGACRVNIKLVFAGLEPKFNSLVGQKMTCDMPLRMIEFPEKDLSYCSGKLKENIQYLVIMDLYKFTAQNLGKQNE